MTNANEHCDRRRARGAVMVEYAVLVAFVVALGLGAWTFLGQRIKCALGFAADQLSADGSGRAVCSKEGASPRSGAPGRGSVAAP